MLYLGNGGAFGVVVNYVVDAPAGVRVFGDVGPGSLRLNGVSAVDVTTASGGITLSEVTGGITAKTSSGPITGRQLRSANIDVTTSSGRIILDLAMPANVRAQTRSRDIELTVPTAATGSTLRPAQA